MAGGKGGSSTGSLEFGGVPGSALMVLGLPVTVYGLTLVCNKTSCSPFILPSSLPTLTELCDLEATLVFLGWFLFQAALYYLPTTPVAGMPVRAGGRLTYRCNAFSAMLASLLLFFGLWWTGYDVTFVYRKFLPLITSATVFSYLLSIALYLKSFTVSQEELAEGGNSGYAIYDFFLGRELNPRIGDFDLKFFCELRPGLIGWFLLDLAFCVQAYEWYGAVSPALIMATAFQGLYVADALWHEEAILTTMDIVHDGFGLMLVFGDLVWVPFLYCLQARYLLEHPNDLSIPAMMAILALNVLGYWIFRASNSQKNAFRKDPNDPKVAGLQSLETSSGRRLLVSGWWGLCRHPNYLGDLLMALAWSLTCGFGSILPYFYPIYFLCLLIHRFERDAESCRHKYGRDWDKYCKLVPYKIFPYIY